MTPGAKAFWATICYAASVLVLGGGAGIWVPIAMPEKVLGIEAVTSYVMAIVSPIIVDLGLNYEVSGKKLPILARSLIVLICASSIVVAMVGLFREGHEYYGWLLAWIGAALSLVAWTYMTLKAEKFLPAALADNYLGGSDATVNKLSGSGL